MGDGRSFRQLAMQIAEPLMVGSPIVNFDSFINHRDDKEEPLEVPTDSDGDEGSDEDVAPITDSEPSITRPAMA